MNFNSKTFKENNYFVLYDLNDNIICYFDDFYELSKYLDYQLRNLVYQYNATASNIITVIIQKRKYKLATFC